MRFIIRSRDEPAPSQLQALQCLSKTSPPLKHDSLSTSGDRGAEVVDGEGMVVLGLGGEGSVVGVGVVVGASVVEKAGVVGPSNVEAGVGTWVVVMLGKGLGVKVSGRVGDE